MSTLLNPAEPFEAHVAHRLQTETILWLGTVSRRGRPHTVPVWFVWDDPTITVFSRPDTAKVTHLRTTDAVSVNLDSAGSGGDIVLGEGRARLTELDDDRSRLDALAGKYASMLGGQPVEGWLDTFSQVIVVTVEKLVTWTASPGGLDHRVFPARDQQILT